MKLVAMSAIVEVRAALFAADWHRGQKHGDRPYTTHLLEAREVAMREAIAEGFDGLERYRRVRRLAASYPITWEKAQRYDDKHGENAAEVIELKLREGRAL